jgi:glycosyltransferase involved in cell wall biosynthesis
MQVILGSDAIHRPLTGIGRYALELARHLRQSPEVQRLDFFSMGRWPTWQDLQACEQPVSPMDGPANASPPRTLRSLLAGNALAVKAYGALTPALYAWRLRNRADALFHSPNYILPPHPGPCVATIHDLSHVWHPQFHPQVRVDYMNRALPQTLKRADFLITDAESVRQEVISHFTWPEDKIAAVPLGVDPIYRPREASEVQGILNQWGLGYEGYTLFVGTVEPRKNLITLLTAYEQLPEKLRMQWPLVIAGNEGWNSKDIHSRMVRAATQGWLRYLRFVDQAQLPMLYAGARLFAYPSVYEGFGLPPLEAMASGVPVVCSNVSSLPEVVGDVALRFSPTDVQGLYSALVQGLEDESWLSHAKSAGRARSENFTWQQCAANTLKIYANCLKQINR